MTNRKTVLLTCLILVVGGGYGLWYFLGDLIIGGTNTERNNPAVPATGPARRWAEPLECEGVENFHRVSPVLYRGAQPTDEGMKRLAEMGIKMIVSFRQFHGDSDEIGDVPLRYKRIRVNAFRPEDDEVAEFLEIVADPDNHPVFVHCLHGADRTGMMCAAYRVAFQGWTKPQAIAEWTEGGFGFHGIFKNMVKYFRKLDIESLLPGHR